MYLNSQKEEKMLDSLNNQYIFFGLKHLQKTVKDPYIQKQTDDSLNKLKIVSAGNLMCEVIQK